MTPSAADIGLHLAKYMKETQGTLGDPARYRALVDLLLEAPSETPADALAHIAWIAAFLPVAIAQLPDDEDPTGGPKAILQGALRMASRAQTALVLTTGLPPETFIGPPGRTH